MNKLKKYEQLIADKLQQLPLPDKEAGWQQMKKLLDDEQSPKRGGTWKWTAMLAILITIGLWWMVETTKSNKGPIAATPALQNDKPTNQSTNKVINDNTATQKTGIPSGNLNTPAASGEQTGIAVNTQKIMLTDNNHPIHNNAVVPDSTGNNPNHPDLPSSNTSSNSQKKKARLSVSAGDHSASSISVNNNSFISKKTKAVKQPRVRTQQTDATLMAVKKQPQRSRKSVTGIPGTNITGDPSATTPNDFSSAGYSPEDNTLLQKQTTLTGNWKERVIVSQLPAANTSQTLLTGNLTDKNWAELEAQLNHAAALQREKIAKLKDLEKLVKKTERRDRLHNGLGNLFKPFSLKAEGEPWWAVGLALNNAVATGSQNRYNYNINAKNNVALDFLPSPYVQFHINDNVYLQTELNLSAPQHTPGILVAQNNFTSGTTDLQRSVFVQKLYYFNWPFSLHYSPVNNFFIGTGIQFSSLQSGLSNIQERNTANSQLVRNSVLKFKDDSTAAVFKTNEWRWQTGADYYWNRFTLGLRYNQAFSKLLNKNQFTPLNYNNNSFLLYMRYNLFEGKRKDK
jgi:hypothetical protein